MQPNHPGAGLGFTLNDQMRPLAMLPFVRKAWEVACDLELPPLDPAPEAGASAAYGEEGLDLPRFMQAIVAWLRAGGHRDPDSALR